MEGEGRGEIRKAENEDTYGEERVKYGLSVLQEYSDIFRVTSVRHRT